MTPPLPSTESVADAGPTEWFSLADEERGRDKPGLRFACTMCGNCCSGPSGYVLFTDEEAEALARRFGMSVQEFRREYTVKTSEGQSLKERKTPHGLDCIFLDRTTKPGKAICGVYEDRPKQCRTWPFWPSVVKSRATWESSSRVCPGIDKGKHYTPVQIRVQRDACNI